MVAVRLEMRGISPKVSLYAKLKARESELLARLGEKDDPKEKMFRTQVAKRDRLILKRPTMTCIPKGIENKSKDNKEKKCVFPGCENVGKSMGKNKDGGQRRRSWCQAHDNEKKRQKIRV